jgi:hypothetical protein
MQAALIVADKTQRVGSRRILCAVSSPRLPDHSFRAHRLAIAVAPRLCPGSGFERRGGRTLTRGRRAPFRCPGRTIQGRWRAKCRGVAIRGFHVLRLVRREGCKPTANVPVGGHLTCTRPYYKSPVDNSQVVLRSQTPTVMERSGIVRATAPIVGSPCNDM